jgi:membrane protease YdiL (CAAX protease family)
LSIRRVFGDGTGRLRTIWRMLLFIVVEALVVVGLQVGFTLALLLLGPGAVAAFTGRPVAAMLAVGPVWVVANLGVVFLFRMLVDRRDVASIGLGRPPAGKLSSPLAGLVLGLAAAGVPLLLLLAAGAMRIDGLGAGLATLIVVPAMALGAFNEELIVRGYLLRNMMDVGRPAWGVLVTSVIFVLPHAANPHFLDSPLPAVNILLSGIALAMAYMVTGNLWFPTALHFGWNAAQAVVFGAEVSGLPMPGILRLEPAEGASALLTGGRFGLEGSLPATAATGFLILLLLLMLRKSRIHGQAVQALTDTPANT